MFGQCRISIRPSFVDKKTHIGDIGRAAMPLGPLLLDVYGDTSMRIGVEHHRHLWFRQNRGINLSQLQQLNRLYGRRIHKGKLRRFQAFFLDQVHKEKVNRSALQGYVNPFAHQIGPAGNGAVAG